MIIFHSFTDATDAIQTITKKMEALEFPEGDVFATRLALDEAIANAIKHGNDADESKDVRLRFLVEATRMLAIISDDGVGFDPTSVRDPTAPENLARPNGRGVMLMRHYMDWIRFNSKGDSVTLCKNRSNAV